MNRIIFNSTRPKTSSPQNPLHRPARRLRQETERCLRDIAYVLHLSRRIKQEMVEEKEAVEV